MFESRSLVGLADSAPPYVEKREAFLPFPLLWLVNVASVDRACYHRRGDHEEPFRVRIMSENPYAVTSVPPPIQPGDPDDRNVDRAIFAPAYDVLSTIGIIVTITFALYAIGLLYSLSVARPYLEQLDRAQTISFVYSLVQMALLVGLCLYSSYRVWRYRGAVLLFLRYQSGWHEFAREHTGYFRATLLLGSVSLAETLVNWGLHFILNGQAG